MIGIVLPVLPTTPFLLLADTCIARSSPRFYHWLVDHPRLGPWIRGYLKRLYRPDLRARRSKAHQN